MDYRRPLYSIITYLVWGMLLGGALYGLVTIWDHAFSYYFYNIRLLGHGWWENVLEGMRSGITLLIGSVPLFILTSWYIAANEKRGLLDSPMMRGGFLYVVFALIVLWSGYNWFFLMSLVVYNEATTSLVLQSIMRMLIGLGASMYIYLLLKAEYNQRVKVSRYFIVGLISFTLMSIICAYSVIGLPHMQESLKADYEAAEDLQRIAYAAFQFQHIHGVYPVTVNDPLFRDMIYGLNVDSYEYQSLGDDFRLCAIFTQNSLKNYTYLRGNFNDLLEFSKGRNCFSGERINKTLQWLWRVPK